MIQNLTNKDNKLDNLFTPFTQATSDSNKLICDQYIKKLTKIRERKKKTDTPAESAPRIMIIR